MATDSFETQEPAAIPEIVTKRSRKRSIIIFVVVSLVNVGLLALLLTTLLTPRAGLTSPTSNDSSITGDAPNSRVGQPAPDFTLPLLNGNASLHLADLKGKAVVLNFWYATCPPCQQEAPFLQQSWQHTLQPKGIIMLGIEDTEAVSLGTDFVNKYGITYQNVRDGIDGATGISYATTGRPETFFINKDGVVVARWIGVLSPQGLQSALSRLHLN